MLLRNGQLGRVSMKKRMAKPFTIRINSIAPQPLSVRETAHKYGVSTHELERVRLFVKRDAASGRIVTGKAISSRNHRSPRKTRGHK